MQEATDFAQALLNEAPPTEKEKQEHLDELKPKINNLLHEYLPDRVTMRDADILGMVMLEIILNPNRFLQK